jgi:hypothetical protein
MALPAELVQKLDLAQAKLDEETAAIAAKSAAATALTRAREEDEHAALTLGSATTAKVEAASDAVAAVKAYFGIV